LLNALPRDAERTVVEGIKPEDDKVFADAAIDHPN
jgi:hypothetical protein